MNCIKYTENAVVVLLTKKFAKHTSSIKNMQGLHTAIITPFNPDGSFDHKSFEKIINAQIDGGVDGILVLGTTGESPTISVEEHDEIIKIAVEITAGRTKVIAGTGSNCTQEAIDRSVHAEKVGADCLLHVSPYYNKPTQKGLYEHFQAVANAVKLPIILYNIAGRCGVNIETDTIIKLNKNYSNIIGVKEASGNLNQIKEVIEKTPDDFLVFSGNDDQNLDIIKLGGHGAISVLSNAIPADMKRFIDLCLDHNWEGAQIIHNKLTPLFQACFIETNPQPIKTLMAHLGYCEEIFRLPMTQMVEENKKELMRVWGEYKN